MITQTPHQLHFPDEMRAQRRWLIRTHKSPKRPRSPLSKCPAGYVRLDADESEEMWRYKWSQSAIYAPYDVAVRLLERRPDKYKGLSFVFHPGDQWERARRLICFDFDGAFDENGELLPQVRGVLEVCDTFAERSQSGRGLHVIAWTECEAFTNVPSAVVGGGCRVDVLCSNAVAVTGDVFEDYSELREIPFDVLKSFPFFKFKPAVETEQTSTSHIWDAPRRPVGEEHENLRILMENWEPAIEGAGREKVSFAATCRLAREGVTGWEAFELLQFAPTSPPLSEDKIRHNIDNAYKLTTADGTFGQGLYSEFPDLNGWTPPEEKEAPADKPNQRIYSIADLLSLNLEQSYLVDDLLVDKQTLVIGGGDKCFKTGIGVDLMLSLATGTPFLGKFGISEVRRGLIYTAEIGIAPAQSLVRRILDARGVDGSGVDNLFVDAYGVPSLTDAKAMRSFEKTLDKYEPQVVMIDPLYFCLTGAAVGDMYAIGGALRNLVQICSDREIWAIICHHTRKFGKQDDPYAPARLSDLYGSGVSAFARQWALVNHRAEFAGGIARLRVHFAGSATGDRYAWDLEINEGIADSLVDGRRWAVTIERSGESSNTATPLTPEAVLRELRIAAASEKDLKKLFPDRPNREWAEIFRWLRSDHRIKLQGDDYTVFE